MGAKARNHSHEPHLLPRVAPSCFLCWDQYVNKQLILWLFWFDFAGSWIGSFLLPHQQSKQERVLQHRSQPTYYASPTIRRWLSWSIVSCLCQSADHGTGQLLAFQIKPFRPTTNWDQPVPHHSTNQRLSHPQVLVVLSSVHITTTADLKVSVSLSQLVSSAELVADNSWKC